MEALRGSLPLPAYDENKTGARPPGMRNSYWAYVSLASVLA